ncbi:hypothetical protein RFI_27982, partial [Reticulomyxa filosa]
MMVCNGENIQMDTYSTEDQFKHSKASEQWKKKKHENGKKIQTTKINQTRSVEVPFEGHYIYVYICICPFYHIFSCCNMPLTKQWTTYRYKKRVHIGEAKCINVHRNKMVNMTFYNKFLGVNNNYISPKLLDCYPNVTYSMYANRYNTHISLVESIKVCVISQFGISFNLLYDWRCFLKLFFSRITFYDFRPLYIDENYSFQKVRKRAIFLNCIGNIQFPLNIYSKLQYLQHKFYLPTNTIFFNLGERI